MTITAFPETTVDHSDEDAARDLARLDPDRGTGGRVGHGVLHEVGHGSLEQRGVGGHGRQRLDPDVQELELVTALAADLDLHGLHGRRANVDANQ